MYSDNYLIYSIKEFISKPSIQYYVSLIALQVVLDQKRIVISHRLALSLVEYNPKVRHPSDLPLLQNKSNRRVGVTGQTARVRKWKVGPQQSRDFLFGLISITRDRLSQQ